MGKPVRRPQQSESVASRAGPVDPWFDSHYNGAAKVVLSLVPRESLAAGMRVIDFGCGEGITAYGVASRVGADVFGVDLNLTYLQLPTYLERNLGIEEIPPNLQFRQNVIGERLPFSDGFADLAYSWSVFEHLSDVTGVLEELHRVLKPGGFLLLQIEPLYYSPHGSHLQRLVNEPWAHLLHEEADYLRMAGEARDHVPQSEQDTLYRTHAFEDVKRCLIEEYKRLNRIDADRLADCVRAARFEIVMDKRIQIEGLSPPARLLRQYPLDLLMTNQVVIIAKRGAAA